MFVFYQISILMFYLNFDNTFYKHNFMKQAKVDDFYS